MKALVASAALLTFAGAPVALAQTASPPSATQTPPPAAAPVPDFTRDLNSGPPRPAEYLAPAPTPAPVVTPPVVTPAPAAPVTTPPPAAAAPRPTPSPAPRPAAPAPSTAAPAPTPRPAAPAAAPTPRPAAPATAAPTTAAPVSPAPRPAPRPAAPTPAPVPPAPVTPAPEPAAPPPPPATPSVTVLDAGARAALPFTAELPSGFQIVTGRPGPDFRIYTIRRGEQSFVMVYVGPASQFPIYSGEQVEAGGRTSVVVTEDGQRRALEHLFQRADAPREVHIWTMSVADADRALAERIAQSIDLR